MMPTIHSSKTFVQPSLILTLQRLLKTRRDDEIRSGTTYNGGEQGRDYSVFLQNQRHFGAGRDTVSGQLFIFGTHLARLKNRVA